VAVVSTGGGGRGGTYVPAMMLFPFTMLSALLFHSITVPFILLAIVQFPAYGIIAGFANSRGKVVPVALAVLAIHSTTAAVLVYAAHHPSQSDTELFIEAVRKGDAPAVKRMLDESADPNTTMRSGASVLQVACSEGHIEIVKVLLDKGAKLNYQCETLRSTALMDAVVFEREEIVRLLLSKGADVTIKDSHGYTALDLAKQKREQVELGQRLGHAALDPGIQQRREKILSLLESLPKDR
jgi:hypothetical protein